MQYPMNLFVPQVWTNWPFDPTATPPSPVMLSALAYANWYATWMLLMRQPSSNS